MSASVFDAGLTMRWMTVMSATVDGEASRLTELDSAIGDADHGSNMQRGFTHVAAGLEQEVPGTPGAVLLLAGRQLVAKVGGAAGPLYGTLLRRTGKAVGEGERIDWSEVAAALRVGVDAVAQLGGAAVGDKTMLDALDPAVTALQEALDAGAEPAEALARAREAAEEGATATVPLQARKGRASYLGERSIGHQDPGATSSALLISALAEAASAGGGDGDGDGSDDDRAENPDGTTTAGGDA